MNCYGGLPSCGPAVARWKVQTGYSFPLCQSCLDYWFDNADDDPDLEPAAWTWIDRSRGQTVDAILIHADPPHIAQAIRDIRRHGAPVYRR